MSGLAERRLRDNSVGYEDGRVNLWALPLWLKGDRLVKAVLTPREARSLAIRLLQAADTAEAES